MPHCVTKNLTYGKLASAKNLTEGLDLGSEPSHNAEEVPRRWV